MHHVLARSPNTIARRFKWTALAAAAVGASTFGLANAAESGIPQALSSINATLNALVATVNALKTSVVELTSALTPTASPSSVATPPLSTWPMEYRCAWHPTSARPRWP